MSVGRLYRSFRAATDRHTVSRRRKRKASDLAVRRRVLELRDKVKAREPLTDEDHRDLAKIGPNTLAAIGYTPRVQLHQPKVTLT